MRIHILGICGTFMAGIAHIARELGHEVSGSDLAVYPPMSEQLALSGIELHQGYAAATLAAIAPELVIIGNAIARSNPALEYILDQRLRYTSGAAWLAEAVLQDRWVLAVSGTHGKTTTTSLLAWVLQQSGYQPGYLIGGVAKGFAQSSSLGQSDFFVIEADEYDTAFFDKRSKFVHFRPNTLIVNNIEYDHADIFPDLAAIQRQFHHLIRTIPSQGLIIHPADDAAIATVLAQGCWTDCMTFSLSHGDWEAHDIQRAGSNFTVHYLGKPVATVDWQLMGEHNIKNALACFAATRHVGIAAMDTATALASFPGVKRRLELLYDQNQLVVYDDFAHHPTAISASLTTLRQRYPARRLILAIELASNSMRAAAHGNAIGKACALADHVFVFTGTAPLASFEPAFVGSSDNVSFIPNVEALLEAVTTTLAPNDCLVMMTNRNMAGFSQQLLAMLATDVLAR